MGSENSKPDHVSDAAWERVQEIRMNKIAEKETEIKELNEQKTASILLLTSNVVDYCSKCHDVPGILMLLPSYRKECADARSAVLKDITGMMSNAASEDAARRVINSVKNM